jgi:hypothetical protein
MYPGTAIEIRTFGGGDWHTWKGWHGPCEQVVVLRETEGDQLGRIIDHVVFPGISFEYL